ncbi:MAG: pentapeptide repeat-containing protein [Cyanobacteria bacterium J06632_22]
MTPEHLIQLYQQGKRDFIWADLRGVSLSGQCLAGANFNRAKLQGSNLSKANLSGCSFLKADLSNADLTAADLQNAHFRKANLSKAMIALEQLPDSALQGATLPDGTVKPVRLPRAVPPVATSQSEASQPASTAADIPPMPSIAPDAPKRWAQGIDVHAEIANRPPPPAPPRPRTRAEVMAAMPWIPVGFFIGGYVLNGLVLTLAAAGGVAWLISAIATQLWAIHRGLTWFIPIVVALAALHGGPLAAFPLLVLPAVIFLMLLGGLLVVGWHWRTALHGATWIAGITAVLFCMAPWLMASPGVFTIIVAPTALLAVLLLLATGSISIGLTGIEAMSIARIHVQHQRWVTGLGGVSGMALGGLMGKLMGVLASP